MKLVSLSRGVVLLLALTVEPATLSGQVTTGDIIGSVVDSSGAIVPKARVAAENLDTHASRQSLTDESGSYSFPLLPIGRYRIQVEANGFKTFQVRQVALASGDRVRADARLEVGQISESVQVDAAPPALQTDSSSLGQVVTRQAVQDLPVNGRNFVTLAQLQPGVNAGAPNALSSGTRPDDRRPNATISVNGFESYMNNFMVDGIDNNDRIIGTVIIRPSMDALAEFRVHTNLYTAEIGRAAGGIVNLITRSGTNSLHGTVFEFFRNDKMDARDFFANAKPAYRLNQFGGSLGGAIRKNKTFFFGDIEEKRQRRGLTSTAVVPAAPLRAGNFAGVARVYDPASTQPAAGTSTFIRTEFPGDVIPASRINPISAQYLSLYPDPNRPGSGNNYSSSFASPQDNTTFDARVDHNFTSNNYTYGRYSFNDTNTFVPGTFPGVNGVYSSGTASFPGPAIQRAQNAVLSHVWVARPTLLVELKAGFTRYASKSLPLNYGNNVSQRFGLNGINYDETTSGLTGVTLSGFTGLGDSQFLPIINFDNVFQYQGSLTKTTGKLTLKVGVVVIRRRFTNYQSSAPIGTIAFDANATNNGNFSGGNSLASFLLGFPGSASRNYSTIWPGYRIWEPSQYVQADWRVKKWLTLNLGGRYDIFTPLREVNHRLSSFDPATGKLLVVGQAGVSETANMRTDYSNFAPRLGFAATLAKGFVLRGGYGISFQPENEANQNFMLKNAPYLSSFAVTNDTFNPAYNISQGFPLPTPQAASAPSGTISSVTLNFQATAVQMYNLTVQKDVGGNVIGAGYVGALTRHIAYAKPYNTPRPGTGGINPRRPYIGILPNITTIGLIASEASGNYHSLQLTFSRRFSGGLSLNGNYNWAHSIDDAGEALPGSRSNDRGNGSLDLRHRWAMTATYDLPFGKSLTGAGARAIQGWKLNAIAVMQSGLPFNVTNATALGNNGSGDRPNRISDGTLSGGTVSRWFDTSAFVAQSPFTFGNSGRNILHGPAQRQLDFSLFKIFPAGEGRRFEFRGEVFNITNTPQFGNPNGALGNPAFGQIGSTVGPPRQLQLAIKFVF